MQRGRGRDGIASGASSRSRAVLRFMSQGVSRATDGVDNSLPVPPWAILGRRIHEDFVNDALSFGWVNSISAFSLSFSPAMTAEHVVVPREDGEAWAHSRRHKRQFLLRCHNGTDQVDHVGGLQ